MSLIKVPEPLSATVKGSFAYITIKDRLPVTITKGIDFIHRFKSELAKRYSEEALEDTKSVIERLSQLRYELQTDKPYRRVEDAGDDAQMWNEAYDEIRKVLGEENCTWFKGPWLFSECYLYRRIREAMLLCKTDMKHYDPYETAKQETHDLSRNSTHNLISSLCPLNWEEEKTNLDIQHERFRIIIEALLWANKNDLSLSSGNDVSSKVKNLIDLLESFKENIICDHTQQLWNHLNALKNQRQTGKKIRIDIVLDNCAIELASDLVFCDFLLRNEYVDEIRLHPKAYQWFISDVCRNDFKNLLRQIQSDNSLAVNKFYSRINNYMNESKLVLEEAHQFWTSPYAFNVMEKKAADLYTDFKQNSSFILLKGDLNYRKLIGDLNWPYDTPLSDAAREFKPTSFCAVRTLKADLCAHLLPSNSNYAKVMKLYPDSNKWMNTGDYGVIQFVEITN